MYGRERLKILIILHLDVAYNTRECTSMHRRQGGFHKKLIRIFGVQLLSIDVPTALNV